MKRLTRAGAGLAAGAAGTAGVVWGLARSRMRSGDQAAADRWLAVTINCPPERLTEPGTDGLPEPIARLGSDAQIRIRPAPGGRGTELALRLPEPQSQSQSRTGIVDRLAGNDPRQRLRSALRDAKSLIETGEVIQPDAPPTTRRTVTGKVVELATRRAGGEGRL